MRVGALANSNLSIKKNNSFHKSAVNTVPLESDKFVSSLSFCANNQGIKLPIKEINKIWRTSISNMRKPSSLSEKEELFLGAKNKFYEKETEFYNQNKGSINESIYEDLCHDSANAVMESFGKIIYYKSYDKFEDEVKFCHKRITDIYKDYQQVISDPNFSNKSYKQVFDFTLKKIQKLADKKNISVSISNKALDDIQNDKLLIRNHNLYLVFNNILGNAIKYTPDGGKIDISFSPLVKDGKKYVAFVVKDTGIGIKQNEIEAAKNGIRATNAVESGIYGTGHGLAKVNKLLKRTLGELDIEPNEGGRGIKVECLIRDSDDYYSQFL